MIDHLLAFRGSQEHLDELYDEYIALYQSEMDKVLKELNHTPKAKRGARHSTKPFWNKVLTDLWRTFHTAEKCFVKCNRNDMGYRAIKARFQMAQRQFDKELRKQKMSFERCKVYNLEKANVENPNEFWKLIASMGPKKSSGIPWEVDYDDGTTSSDREKSPGKVA